MEEMYIEGWESRVSKDRFSAIGIATVLYAVLFGLCLYNNLSGIMTLIMAVVTAVYLIYSVKRLENVIVVQGEAESSSRNISYKKLIPYLTGIVMLGISVCCTADSFIITIDYIGMFLLIMCAIIRSCCSDKGWDFRKYAQVIVKFIFSPFKYLNMPFKDYIAFKKASGKKMNGKIKYVVAGIFISVPLLFIVISLLASADWVFYSMVGSMIEKIQISWDIVGMVILILAVFVYTYGLMAKMSGEKTDEKMKNERIYEPVIGITFMGMLTFVYLVFSVIQIMYLFAADWMIPEGYTYAEYARQGFFQLLFVAALNLLLVLICLTFFRKSTVLNIILTVMSGCTYIMIASSAIRMILYIQMYDLTYLRILVLLALLMIAVIMAGVIVFIYREQFPLVNYCILAVGIIYIVFSFCKPGYIIAEYNLNSRLNDITAENIENNEIRYGDDFLYLFELGEDAAPALYKFAETVYSSGNMEMSCVLEGYFESYFAEIEVSKDDYSIVRGFNFSRHSAYKYAERYRLLLD